MANRTHDEHSASLGSAPLVQDGEHLVAHIMELIDLRIRPLSRAEVPACPVRVERAHEVEVRDIGYCSRPTALRACSLLR
jgi:hypothetical protein